MAPPLFAGARRRRNRRRRTCAPSFPAQRLAIVLLLSPCSLAGSSSLTVACYASDSGKGKDAPNSVGQCLRALTDSLPLHASRNEPDVLVKSMMAKTGIAVDASDSSSIYGVLQSVPQDVLDRGKAAADPYRIPEDTKPEIRDPEIKQLESPCFPFLSMMGTSL